MPPFLLHRLVPLAACSAAALLSTSPALAKGAKESKRAICTAALTAYRSAIQEEQERHLREARASFQTCAEATVCSFAPRCKVRYEKLVSEMPTIVPVVIDENGQPLVDVQVNLDGQPLTSHLDGKALAVEVGLHDLTFATTKGVFATERVLVIEGQHNREIAVRFGGSTGRAAPAAAAAPESSPAATVTTTTGTPPAAGEKVAATKETAPSDVQAPAPGVHEPEPAPPRGRGVLPYVFGGVGVLGLGAATALTVWGRQDNDGLGQCSPHCPQSSVDHIRVLYTLADVAVGVGVAGLALGAYFFWRSPSSDTASAPRSALHFDVAPTRSGAFASMVGDF